MSGSPSLREHPRERVARLCALWANVCLCEHVFPGRVRPSVSVSVCVCVPGPACVCECASASGCLLPMSLRVCRCVCAHVWTSVCPGEARGRVFVGRSLSVSIRVCPRPAPAQSCDRVPAFVHLGVCIIVSPPALAPTSVGVSVQGCRSGCP